jgi:hypothetical protein
MHCRRQLLLAGAPRDYMEQELVRGAGIEL